MGGAITRGADDLMLRHKVLIVDDAPTNIQTLHSILSPEHDILFSTSGDDAITMALREHPDVILLDILMPGMDGLKVCAALKEDPRTKDIPVIFVTVMGEVDDETRGLKLGAIDYIVKPFSPSIIRMRVRNHLELKRHRDLLKALSTLDGLTGMANRRGFEEHLRQEWARAVRLHSSVALIMIDIDQFEMTSDRKPTVDEEDRVRQVANALGKIPKRPADRVARVGGEEFACVLPDTDERGALRIADLMRQHIEELRIVQAVSDTMHHLTISLGVAAAPTSNDGWEELVRIADERLRQAKNTGRNRIASASPTE